MVQPFPAGGGGDGGRAASVDGVGVSNVRNRRSIQPTRCPSTGSLNVTCTHPSRMSPIRTTFPALASEEAFSSRQAG